MTPRRIALCVALAFAGSVLPALAEATPQDMLLAVKVSGTRGKPIDLVVREDSGRYYLSPADLVALGLSDVQGWRRVEQDQLEYVELTSLGELNVNQASLTATLTLPPESLPTTRVQVGFRNQDVQPVAEAGAHVNYRIGADHNDRGLRHYGVIDGHVTTSTGWDYAATVAAGTGLRPQIGEAAATLRLPAARQSLRFGTAYTTPGAWGVAGRIAGVQYRTDRSLQPGYNTRPTTSFSGLATAQGTAQLYVDGRPSGSAEVNAGPFALDGVTMPYTAGGTVTAQITDITGRTQTVTAELIGAPYNLRQGLSEFALEAGLLRRATVGRNEYGGIAASGTYAAGITDTLTLEGHGEIVGNRVRAGVTATYASKYGTLVGSAALGSQGQGLLARAAYYYSSPRWMLSASVIAPGRHKDYDDRLLARQAAATATFRINDRTSLTATYGRYGEHDRAGLGVSTSFTNRVSGSLAVERTSFGGSAVYAQLAIAFDDMHTAASARSSYGKLELSSTTQMYRRDYTGMQVRTSSSQSGGNGYQRLDAGYAGYGGEISGAVSRAGERVSASLEATGAIVAAGGGLRAARYIHDAYAVIQLPEAIPNVPVQQHNRTVGRTDGQGIAVVPAYAFLENEFSLDARNLPATILSGSSARGTPYRHGPVTIALQAQRPGVLLDIAGATAPVVEIAGQRGWNLADGGYYVDGLAAGIQKGRAGECVFTVEIPAVVEIGTEVQAECEK